MDGDRMISLNEDGLSRRKAMKATATGAALGTHLRAVGAADPGADHDHHAGRRAHGRRRSR